MTIRTRPATQEYRDNYDAIFGSQRGDTQLEQAYAKADREVEKFGLAMNDTLAAIVELGGDVSRYD